MVTGHGRVERIVRVWLPVGFFMLLALFPFYWMAITSVKPNAELYNRNMMPLLVHNPTLKHYVGLLTETSFLLWTWNTLLVAAVSTAMSLVLGTRAGGGKDTPVADRRKDVTIFDIYQNAASAKIYASGWVDYLHLAKWNGRWVIVNVLWELHPRPQ